MKSRPILFSAPMVCALLDGSKTQTRRVVKPKIAETLEWFGGKSDADDDRELDELLGQRTEEKGLRVWCFDYPEEGSEVIRSPYGQPGDLLWVRESFQPFLNDECDGDLHLANWKTGENYHCTYPATNGIHEFMDADDNLRSTVKPSIHMPRWASRITLEVTGVRVERLQDISEEDAKAEGCKIRDIMYPDEPRSSYSYADQYRILWESINGLGTWDANPWVWVIEFKVVMP